MKNKIIPYNPRLKNLARILRKSGIMSEALLWTEIKNRALGYEFHRQVPILNYIVDFYCHELMMVIEIDGPSHDHKYVKDMTRDNDLERMGIKVLRFDDREVRRNMDNVLRVIASEVKKIERSIDKKDKL